MSWWYQITSFVDRKYEDILIGLVFAALPLIYRGGRLAVREWRKPWLAYRHLRRRMVTNNAASIRRYIRDRNFRVLRQVARDHHFQFVVVYVLAILFLHVGPPAGGELSNLAMSVARMILSMLVGRSFGVFLVDATICRAGNAIIYLSNAGTRLSARRRERKRLMRFQYIIW